MIVDSAQIYLAALDAKIAAEPDRGYRAARLNYELETIATGIEQRLEALREENRREIIAAGNKMPDRVMPARMK